ncbi:MAG TPA: HAD family phosphatase [Bacillus bacterium]|nr:HAD family phosphatase [Bacillus sp. (in: firmicutes)]
MIKMIFSDLDGTLLSNDNKVRDDDSKAIKIALQNGIDVCLASGRKDIDIQAVADIIGSKFHRISQNGAFVFSRDNQELHRTSFDPIIVKKLYERISNEEVITILSTIDKEYVEKKDELIFKIEKRLFSPIEEEKELKSEIGKSIHVSKIINIGTEKTLHQLQKELKETYPEELDTFLSETHILDVMPKNISKGNAIQILLKHTGLKPNQIACIGDSYNDIPMFHLTKHSFAMSSAHPDVKKEASFIVDTVAEAIEQIMKFEHLCIK